MLISTRGAKDIGEANLDENSDPFVGQVSATKDLGNLFSFFHLRFMQFLPYSRYYRHVIYGACTRVFGSAILTRSVIIQVYRSVKRSYSLRSYILLLYS